MPDNRTAIVEIHRLIFRIFLRLLRIIPGKANLGRFPGIRESYLWLSRLFPKEMTVEFRGNKMYLRPADGVLERGFLLLGRTYEEGVTRLFYKLVKRGMTVVDIGAHIGYYTLIAAKLVGPEGKVFAFEPEPGNFSLLKRNVELNGYENVTLINRAVSDSNSVVTLYLDSVDSGAHGQAPDERTKGSIPVTATLLDESISSDVAIDFVKMDIEGGEEKALDGMQRILREAGVETLLLEFFPQKLEGCDSSPKRLWDKLNGFGFGIHEIADKGIGRISFDQALRKDRSNLLCLRE